MKKKYICPRIEVTELMSESLMQAVSIDNTGNRGSDGEQQTVVESGNADIEVGSKENNMWDNSYNVWE